VNAQMMFALPDELTSFTFIEGLPLARQALAYASELHQGQRRESDEAPFILHPLEVAALLHNSGHGEVVVAAGILHDTVEDSDIRTEDIAEHFGSDVAALVAAMTEDPNIEPYDERKAALRMQIAEFGQDAVAVYAADKVAKVRELRAHAGREPSLLHGKEADARPRLDHYIESLAMLEQAVPEHPLVRQLRFELEALRALPPALDGITPDDVRRPRD
jgi:(p)ppGpp synthase/HD superfamily hydrolase